MSKENVSLRNLPTTDRLSLILIEFQIEFFSSSMPVREISNDNLNGELTSAADKVVLVDFFATWFDSRRKKKGKFLIEFILGAARVNKSLRLSNN